MHLLAVLAQVFFGRAHSVESSRQSLGTADIAENLFAIMGDCVVDVRFMASQCRPLPINHAAEKQKDR